MEFESQPVVISLDTRIKSNIANNLKLALIQATTWSLMFSSSKKEADTIIAF